VCLKKATRPVTGAQLDMNVNHGKKNRNTLAFATHEFRLGRRVNHVHFAVTGADDEVRAGWHHRVRIAEEIKGEDGEQHPKSDKRQMK